MIQTPSPKVGYQKQSLVGFNLTRIYYLEYDYKIEFYKDWYNNKC